MCTDQAGRRPLENAGRRRRPASAGSPLVVGLVGPAGSGKSTLARALEGAHVRVLDADRYGHELGDGDPDVRAALMAEYGPGVYRSDGTLDRAQVAAKVFSDPAALARLNALMHPRIVERLRAEIARAGRERFAGTLIVDAALLLDWGFERECDAVIAVVAPRELQVERLRAKRGWSAAEAERRLAHARSSEDFEALADVVVVNDGSEARAVQALADTLARCLAARERAAARERRS